MANLNLLSFAAGALKSEAERMKEADRRARKDVEKTQELQKAMALERYKSQMDRYNKDSEMARKLEAAGGGSTFAQVYYSGLSGIPMEQVRKDLDPSTDVGKKNLEWFENEKNRNAIISHLRGSKKPTLTLDLDNPEFDRYIAERRRNASLLLHGYRKATGRPIKKLPNIMESKMHERRLSELMPESDGLRESLEKLGIKAPSIATTPDENRLSNPITYYKDDGTAIKAFTVEEARDYESKGLSVSKPGIGGGTKNPITLYSPDGQKASLRADDPRVDVAIEKGWSTTKPDQPLKATPLQKSERDSVVGIVQSISPETVGYEKFGEAWDEADSGEERNNILNAIFNEVSSLRADRTYRDESLETLTNIAINNVTPRIKVTGSIFQDVTLAPREVIRETDDGRKIVYDSVTKQPLREIK